MRGNPSKCIQMVMTSCSGESTIPLLHRLMLTYLSPSLVNLKGVVTASIASVVELSIGSSYYMR